MLCAAPGETHGLARIGAMMEAPAFYPYLSGCDNLRVIAAMPAIPEDRIEEVLDEVGLTDRASDRSRTTRWA